MKNAFVSLVLLAFVSPAVADEALLTQLGLQDLQVVSEETATEVRGLGFVSADGTVNTSLHLDVYDSYDVFENADGDSTLTLLLQGLSNLEGVIGGNNNITVDFSQAEIDGANFFDYAGTLTVTAGAVASGSAN